MTRPQKQWVVIEPESVLLVFGLVFAVWLVIQVQQVLVVVFIAWLLASTLQPTITWLEKHKIPRLLGISSLFLFLLLALGGFAYLLGDLIARQTIQLIHEIPVLINKISGYISRMPAVRADFVLEDWLNLRVQALVHNARSLILPTISYLASFFGLFLSGLSILVLAFLMLIAPSEIEKGVIRLLPLTIRPRAEQFLQTVSNSIGLYIRGQVTVAAIIAFLTWLGLTLLGVPYALVLGLLAFLMDFIPVLGSLLAAVLAVVIALGENPTMALWTVLLYLVVNQLESNLVGPLIVGKAVGFSPFWIIFSILIGGTLYGIPGAFLAIPVAVIIKLALDEFYVKQDTNPTLPEPYLS